MNIQVEPGKYIVAVSGGVDSMALLHALQSVNGVELVVTHFDHGIRPDSEQDRLLVEAAAARYGLPFIYGEGKLGPQASEEAARRARYGFLHDIRSTQQADAVITAHHRDDVLESAIINILRGTGRKGLSSLRSTDIVKRPLLHVPKADILEYAHANGLQWREDSTNADPAFLRNHIRHQVVPRLAPQHREALHGTISRAHTLNQEIEVILAEYLKSQIIHGQLSRRGFILLPHKVALEVMAAWLRGQGIRSFDKKMLERLVRAAKIQRVGTRVSVQGGVYLRIGKEFLALEGRER